MRIAKIKDGHYAKVLSPQFTGVIGRLYEEVRQRKVEDAKQAGNMEEQKLKTDQIAKRIASISIRYEEMDTILKRLFPVDETKAYIDRSMEVDGSVKADTFIATAEDVPPLTVNSKLLVKNLNVEMVGGQTVEEFQAELDMKAAGINERLDVRLLEERDVSEGRYTPIAHVNAGGPGIHPYATERVAGFMSDLDKIKLNKLVISKTEPPEPKKEQIWIDIS